jgi:hypothetical protein
MFFLVLERYPCAFEKHLSYPKVEKPFVIRVSYRKYMQEYEESVKSSGFLTSLRSK